MSKKVNKELDKEVNKINEVNTEKLIIEPETEQIKQEDQIKQSEIKGVKTNEEFPYVVEMYDIWGATSKRAVRIGAKRWTDGKNVYLVNDKVNFKEPFPIDTDDYKQFKISEIENGLNSVDKQLSKLKKNGSSNAGLRDLEEEKRLLTLKKRGIQLRSKGSYMIIDSDEAGGKPLFLFDRVGALKIPLWKDVDLSLIAIPDERNLAEASELLKENEEKNGGQNLMIKAINILLMVILGLMVCFLGWLAFKMSVMPVEVANVLSGIVDKLGDVTSNMDVLVEAVTNSTAPTNETIKPVVEPNVNVINK